MRYLAAIAGILALASPALAADKGAPATLEQILAMPDRKAATCHVQASAAGTFLRDNREAQFGAGLGCDVILANMILGSGVRAEFADFRNTSSVFAKMGLVVNSGANLYLLASWNVKDLRARQAGQGRFGAGAEMKMEFINPGLWIFAEGEAPFTKFGPGFEKDELNIRTGIRLKF